MRLPRRAAPPVLAGATLVAFLAPWGCRPEGEPVPDAVVLALGDGLGIAHLTLARHLVLAPGARFSFEGLPALGLVTTHSATNAVTDSGAATTSLVTGAKGPNRSIGLDERHRPLATLADRARDRGWAVGFVTTTSVVHATPAALYAHVENRYDYGCVASQLLTWAPDLAFGGGRRHFLPEGAEGGEREDGRDLLEEARQAGFQVWRRLPAAPPGDRAPLLGVFAAGHLPYELDRAELPASDRPASLEEMTRWALEALSREDRSFLLLVEGGRIDHAGHSFDPAGVAAEVAAFDRAVTTVLQFQERRPRTLVLLTADHATGGLAINDFADWSALRRQRVSVEALTDGLLAGGGASRVAQATGFGDYSEEEAERVRAAGAEDRREAQRVLGRQLADRHGVTWVPRVDPDETDGHTGDDVPLWASGPGAARFRGPLDNTEVATRLVELLGWERVPEVSPESLPECALGASGEL